MKTSKSIIEDYYKAFNEKRFSDMLKLLSDDVVHDINQGERQKGKKHFADFMEIMNAYYDENLTDMVIIASEDGKRAAAEFICHGKYLKSAPGLPPAQGQKYSLPVGAFFELQNGLIRRVTNYYNMQDWIHQVSR